MVFKAMWPVEIAQNKDCSCYSIQKIESDKEVEKEETEKLWPEKYVEDQESVVSEKPKVECVRVSWGLKHGSPGFPKQK